MSTRRPPRDPAAPKRNMSAYLLYQNAMRDTFKQQVRKRELGIIGLILLFVKPPLAPLDFSTK